MASDKDTPTFHDRYASDPEFKQQVDEQRQKAAIRRDRNALQEALDMIRGVPGSPKKYY